MIIVVLVFDIRKTSPQASHPIVRVQVGSPMGSNTWLGSISKEPTFYSQSYEAPINLHFPLLSLGPWHLSYISRLGLESIHSALFPLKPSHMF